MKSAVVLLASACIFLALLSLGNARQPMLTVGDISHTKAGEGTEQVGITLSSENLPVIFLIDGDKPRLVLDFADSRFTGKPPAAVKSGGLVQGIRVGTHSVPKPKTRIVIDLAAGRTIKWNKEFLARENLLKISISDRNHAAPSASVTAPARPAAPSAPAAPAAPETAIAPAAPAALTLAGKTQPAASPPPVIARGYSKIKVLPQPAATLAETSEPPPAAAPVPSAPAAEPAPSAPVAEAAVADATGGEKASTAEQPESRPVLLDVSFDNEFTRSGEMVLLKLTDFQPPKITAEEKDPPRIYCDFAGARIGEGVKGVNDTGGKYVEKIRVLRTENPSAVRVTLELAAGNNYDLQQVFFKEDSLFVLIVNILDKE